MYVCHVTCIKKNSIGSIVNLSDGILHRSQIAGIGHQSLRGAMATYVPVLKSDIASQIAYNPIADG